MCGLVTGVLVCVCVGIWCVVCGLVTGVLVCVWVGNWCVGVSVLVTCVCLCLG